MTTIAIEDLEELLATKGWAWLGEQIEASFGPAVMMEKVIQVTKDTTDLHAKTAAIDALLAQRVVVTELLARPQREISKQREALARPVDGMEGMRRRGAGL
jgi:hypothetical protein